MNSAFVGCEELSGSRRVLSTLLSGLLTGDRTTLVLDTFLLNKN